MSDKPKVFVGSSKESLPVLQVIQHELADIAEVVAWTAERNWELGRFTLECLVSRSREFDYAVLIFAGDDEVISRGQDYVAPRDNVVFELGLFMSQLDRARTIVVTPRGVKMLSDLSGLNAGYYDTPKRKKSESDAAYEKRLAPGLAPVIEQLRTRISLGARPAVDPAPRSGPRDVHDLGGAIDEILSERMSRSKITTVRNLALDMEVTWGLLRDRILSSDFRMKNLTWYSLMVDPESEMMKSMGSDSVSVGTAMERIKDMRLRCPKLQSHLAGKKVEFACRAYSAVPTLHGFLIDDDVLLLSLCSVVDGRLDGAATPFWRFQINAAHPQTNHIFKSYRNWFDHYWATGRNIWPL